MSLLPILIPFFNIFLIFFLSGFDKKIIYASTIFLLSLGAMFSWAISLGLVSSSSEMISIPWLLMIDLNINFGVGWSPISSYISSIIYIVFILVIIYSLNDLGLKQIFNRTIAFICGLLFFVQILLASSYIGQIVFAWVGIIFSILVLTGININQKKGIKNNAIIFLIFNLLSVLLFIASVEVGNVISDIDSQNVENVSLILGFAPKDIIVYFFIISLLVPFAVCPFNFWVESVVNTSSAVSGLLFGVVLLTASYILFHVLAIVDISEGGRIFVAIICLLSTLLSSMVAINRKNIFGSLAYVYSAVASFVMFGFAVYSSEYVLLFSIVQLIAVTTLFLIAGAISFSLSGEENMTKMGGLAKRLPGIYFIFFVAVIAILSIPPFSGFFAKTWLFDNILIENQFALWIGLLFVFFVQFMLARVFGRIWGMVFYGDENQDELVKAHMVGTSNYVLFSLIMFSILLLLSGWIAEKVFFNLNSGESDLQAFNIVEFIGSIAVSIGGLFYGFKRTIGKSDDLESLYRNNLVANNFYIYDSVYLLFGKPFLIVSEFLQKYQKPYLAEFISKVSFRVAYYITTGFNFALGLPMILTVMLLFVIFALIVMLFSMGVK